MWADVPEAEQFVVGLVYQQSESYHIWANGHNQYPVSWPAGGESYGIDITQGYLALQYGLTARWTLDLEVGYTTVGWRYFDNGGIQYTDGLMDTALGVRYQIFNEAMSSSPWTPTLTFRAGVVLPGTYEQAFVYAPGNRSVGVEPELLARKHFGWPGLGGYFDGLFRWNQTTGNNEYMVSVGMFQQVGGWELDAGYVHWQAIWGQDIQYDPSNPSSIVYPVAVREIYDAIDVGFSYTSSIRHIRWGFWSRIVLDGSNSDAKWWQGVSVDIPIGGKRH